MSEVRENLIINIDGKECSALSGESILNVARRNKINIPTLCDLKKLSPTGACRMCIVEEENGNIVASCKSYVTKSISVKTNTQKLQKYRNQIMSFLCINHPLECGVCDKSGECELQDKVLETKVDIQPFFALQKKQDFVHFHNKIYDESLCIMCERCARTCNEFVGNNVLNVLAGGFSSKIGVNFNAYCEDCDECVSVCPTGAMISERFVYTSNAWELEKNPSRCLHCSLRCELFYEVKHDIDSNKQVYRIKNEAHIKQLCHAGRHNFLRTNPLEAFHSNFYNQLGKNQNLSRTRLNDFRCDIESILANVDAIRLDINVTNEEAFLAQKLASRAQKKLYCNEALYYKEFGEIIKSISNKSFTTIHKALLEANSCIVLGSYLFDEIPVLRSDLSKLALKKGLKNIWIHTLLENRFKSDLAIKYEAGSELAISAFLLNIFAKSLQDSKDLANLNFISSILSWLNNLDLGNLIAESNISDMELQELSRLCVASYDVVLPNHEETTYQSKVVVLVGQDFYMQESFRNIAQVLGAIDSLDFVEVLPIPYGNANGIKEICTLSYDSGEYKNVLGIRVFGEYSLAPSRRSKNCYPIIPLQFIEGSMVDLDYNLVKISASFVETSPFNRHGIDNFIFHDLLDICKDYLELDMEYLTDVIPEISFCKIPFENGFDDFQSQSLVLPFAKIDISMPLDAQVNLNDGSGIYVYKPALSGNLSFYKDCDMRLIAKDYMDKSPLQDVNTTRDSIPIDSILQVSSQFCIATNLKNDDVISFQFDSLVLDVRVEVVNGLKGMIAILLSEHLLSPNKYYDYKSILITK
ncbi:2Fe-2S iron-sulfur cluster-binding protein [Helicobacter muridarum]|nr:2Fe-2S iron-sulfur cluster-binding protein [Helicobacter muridarum]STQ85489.1 NADH dehydrogenase subunit G [Helicobacter muridarum]